MSDERKSKSLLTLPDSGGLALSIRAKAIVFSDEKSQAILERLRRVAPSDASALIIGETGTGKELVARHIHECSGRSGPFVAVNCGAFSENLIESELFGHEAGSFTGATQARPGWFEAANGGTLFLDEIGDLPLQMQVKLLRVLQERQVVRLGSRKSIPIDVRLVAATNVDLAKAVAAGHFRADLYYRLNVAMIPLPPLRERRGDILPLANYFLDLYRNRLNIASLELSAEAEHLLLRYAWPGNIRELENVIHYAVIVAEQQQIQPGDLRLSPAELAPWQVAEPEPQDPFAAIEQQLLKLFAAQQPDLYNRLEETIVRSAYAQCRGNQVRSARLLGLSRNVLRSLLKRFGYIEAREHDDVEDLVV